MAFTTSPLTAADLEQLPQGDVRRELVRGVLVELSPAGREHGRLLVNVIVPLQAFAEVSGRGETLVRVGFILARDPDTVRAPDVAWLGPQRVEALTSATGYIEGAPDLAIEIVAPTDRAADIDEKVQEYLAAGTRLVWVAQPRTRTVYVFQPGGIARVVGPGGTLDGGDVLPGFALPLADLWPA